MMGSDSKKNGAKCQCTKKGKKPQKMPQRGPGVAELEKIIGHQPPDQRNPFYGPFIFRHFPPQPLRLSGVNFPRTNYFRRQNDSEVFSNMMRSEQSQEANADSNYGLSYTQMMLMDDEHPLFQLSMDSVCPSYLITAANPGHESFTQNFYNRIGLDRIQPNLQSLQLGQPGKENGKALTVRDQGNVTMKKTAEASGIHNVKSSEKLIPTLSLGPPSKTEHSSESWEGPQMKIFGFNLEEKEPSIDRTRLSLENIAEGTSSLEHDLDLELKL